MMIGSGRAGETPALLEKNNMKLTFKKRLLHASVAIFIAASLPLSAQTNKPNEKIILSQALETNRCYVGEAISVAVTWCIYPPIGLFKNVDIRLPAMESNLFKTYDSYKTADQPDSKSLGIPLSGTRAIANLTTVKLGDHDYTSLKIKKIVVPVSSGTQILNPATVSCVLNPSGKTSVTIRNTAQGSGNLYQYPLYFNNAFFDREIDSSDLKISTSSSSNILEVLPLPKNAPALFSGLVGEFQFSVSISTNSLRQGDPLVLLMNVTSYGYLAHVNIPPLELQSDLTQSFRVAADRRMQSIDNHSIVFSQTVYPVNAGKQEFPSLTLCFFNPTSRKYETSSSSQIPITVKNAQIIDGSALGIASDEVQTKSSIWRWVIALAALTTLTRFIYMRYKKIERPKKDRSKDLAAAYQQFQNTVALLNNTDFSNTRDQYSALNSALSSYIAVHLPDHRPGAITFSDISQLLHEQCADTSVINKARTLFNEMDICRFSPAAPTMDYKTTVNLAMETSDSLSKDSLRSR